MHSFGSNRSRKTIAVATLVMASAFAHHANAKVLGKVDAMGTYIGTALTPANAWSAAWGNAWNACRDQHPGTRSINMTWHQFGSPSPAGSNTRSVASIWECRDTK
ncbi:hypothetical protein [Ralstonia pseudosolanacearum]|uniref:hypothetical protein n=1 Tax=Ralstonia pseudosolanacearum TaxID=1310165 RepID=UPI001FF8AA1A|nr:hypothetical protein [Ralstonia pseudosolanacearum]